MITRRARELVISALREYASQASVHGVGYVFSGHTLGDRLLWLGLVLTGLVSASILSHDLYVSWQKAPVVTDLKDTNKQVRDLEFPSVTICTEGINMEAVLNTLNQDFSDWLERNGFQEDSEQSSEEGLSTFLLETFNLQPSDEISLQDIVLAYSSTDPDQTLMISSITDMMITCQSSEDCQAEDYQYQGSCYKVVDTEVTWTEANYTCPLYGGYTLASVHNIPERNFVANLSSSPVWLGALWATNSSHPSWADGQHDPAGCSAQPDQQLLQHADYEQGLLLNSLFRGSWTRLPTSEARGYICKKGE